MIQRASGYYLLPFLLWLLFMFLLNTGCGHKSVEDYLRTGDQAMQSGRLATTSAIRPTIFGFFETLRVRLRHPSSMENIDKSIRASSSTVNPLERSSMHFSIELLFVKGVHNSSVIAGKAIGGHEVWRW